MRMKLSWVKQQQSLIVAEWWWGGWCLGFCGWHRDLPDFCQVLRQNCEMALVRLGKSWRPCLRSVACEVVRVQQENHKAEREYEASS